MNLVGHGKCHNFNIPQHMPPYCVTRVTVLWGLLREYEKCERREFEDRGEKERHLKPHQVAQHGAWLTLLTFMFFASLQVDFHMKKCLLRSVHNIVYEHVVPLHTFGNIVDFFSNSKCGFLM